MSDSWISTSPEYLPDFIIGGAMKSGTTTLHAILDKHPDISIAKDELGFFDIDNLLAHPDFNLYKRDSKTWVTQNFEENSTEFWNWYHSKFKNLSGALKGEDSTTYLASSWAAQRINKQNKKIKLLFVLRHPTKRAISNYLHLLKSGRAIYSLEKTLQHNPRSIIDRSLYKDQLDVYYKNIPSERIKIILFEDLISNPKSCITDICDYLEIDSKKFNKEDFLIHSNKTRIPKHFGLQLFRNRLFINYGLKRYSNFLPNKLKLNKRPSLFIRVFDKIHKKINPLREDVVYTVNDSTLDLLNSYFKKELKGIDELTGLSIYNRWFKE